MGSGERKLNVPVREKTKSQSKPTSRRCDSWSKMSGYSKSAVNKQGQDSIQLAQRLAKESLEDQRRNNQAPPSWEKMSGYNKRVVKPRGPEPAIQLAFHRGPEHAMQLAEPSAKEDLEAQKK